MTSMLVLFLLAGGCSSVFGHELRTFVVFCVVVPFVELDREAAIEDILRKVSPRCMGMAKNDALQEPIGLGIFLGGIILGCQRLAGMVDDPGMTSVGRGPAFCQRGWPAIDFMRARYS